MPRALAKRPLKGARSAPPVNNRSDGDIKQVAATFSLRANGGNGRTAEGCRREESHPLRGPSSTARTYTRARSLRWPSVLTGLRRLPRAAPPPPFLSSRLRFKQARDARARARPAGRIFSVARSFGSPRLCRRRRARVFPDGAVSRRNLS